MLWFVCLWQWSLLAHSALIGKALEVFSCLSVDQCKNHQLVKQAVWSALLVPEPYWQQFCQCWRSEGHTFVEFFRRKTIVFRKYLDSENLKNDFYSLSHLLLSEDAKKFSAIQEHLQNRRVCTLGEASPLADLCALTHSLYNYRPYAASS